jgi:hypothetical protein
VSTHATAELQTLAFGRLDAGVWGCAWIDGTAGVAALGRLGPAENGSDGQTGPVTVTGSAEGEDWVITGSGDLRLSLTVTATSTAASSAALPGFEQLCRVRGHATLGDDREIDCLGVRAVRTGLDLAQLDSLREVSAWFEPGEGLSLTAVRPRGVRGHDRDAVAAAVFDADGVSDVEDPRLSTTYGRDALPLRAGLELWLAAETDEEQHYPRRAAGGAHGAGVRLKHAGLELQARPLRWTSRGLEGTGVYVLARAG